MIEKIGVVLLNLGGPDSLDAVEPFLFNLFSDPDIIDFPLSFLFRKRLAKLISSRRSPMVRGQYERIGGKSPLKDHTLRQAALLEEKLNERFPAKVYAAMRYWHPSTEEALDAIEKDGIKKVILLPLYPQYSKATTESSVKEWEKQLELRGDSLQLETMLVESYYDFPYYIAAFVDRINEGLERFPAEQRQDTHILFSAHGTPMKLVRQGDPYSGHIKQTVQTIISQGGYGQDSSLCYQSKVGPMKWLTPSTPDTIKGLAAKGVKNMLVVPVAFASDHLETLFELGIEYRHVAKNAGVEQYEVTTGLNDSPLFIDALARLVFEKARRHRDAKNVVRCKLMNKRVGVIGGGISGLCTAYGLKKAGIEVVLFEKGTSVGGNIKTEKRDGFLYEHGPNSTLTSRALLDLIDDLGISDEIAAPKASSEKRYIVRGGKLIALPSDPFSLIGTKAFSGASKFALLKEPFKRNRGADDESVSAFFERRLGNEIVDYAVDPFISGIYAGDPQKLAIRHAFPKLYEWEKGHGSIIKGAIFAPKNKAARLPKGTARSLSFKNGMQTLSDALERELGGIIRKNIAVRGSGWTDEGKVSVETPSGTEVFDSLVICTPAHAAARLVEGFDGGLSAELSNIYYPPIAVVYTGFKNGDVRTEPDGFGFLVPGIERRRILGSLWTSSIFEGRAPDGHHLFTTFLGGSRSPEICDQSDEELMKSAIDEINSIMGLAGEPVFSSIKRWEKAIPQYNVGYGKFLRALNTFRSAHPGIFFCSNFYNGISVSDCVKNGELTANEVAGFLRS